MADEKRSYLSQADVPSQPLDVAIRVPEAIARNYAKKPTRPLLVAQAMNLAPTGGQFRSICGASIAYGLTEGGYGAQQIEITPLGKRIVAPLQEGDDSVAKREAVLRPSVVGEFLSRYDGSPLPANRIATNVLEEMGVPEDRADRTLQLILENAEGVGFLQEIKGQKYVDLQSPPAATSAEVPDLPGGTPLVSDQPSQAVLGEAPRVAHSAETAPAAPRKHERVFITHGRDKKVVTQIKDLLQYGGFIPVVAVEAETMSVPVPEKVLAEMKTCGAAVIHFAAEREITDTAGATHRLPNNNVLIEVGVALALYGNKFVLLVEEGLEIPSNLQGLYYVQYPGGELGYEATMKILKAFKDFRG